MNNLKKQHYSYVTENDYIAVAGPDWPNYDVFIEHRDIPDFVYNEIDSMLAVAKDFDHVSFCVNPFYSYELPNKSHCCHLPEKYNIEKIQKQMLNGHRPNECSKCWELEDQNLQSDRQIKNQSLAYWSGLDLQQLFDHAKQGNIKRLHYKIDTTNRCNATCVTCCSFFSSSWALLEAKNDLIASSSWSLDINEIDQYIDYENAKMISFRGGEPLLSNANFKILEKLVNAGNTDCWVGFVTNGSLQPTARQTKILNQFTNVNFNFSIDGVKGKFEYMRYPLKWSTLLENIAWARSQNFTVSAAYTVSNLNAIYYKETVEWFEQNKIPYWFNQVSNPSYFAINLLPSNIIQSIDSANIRNLIQQLPECNNDDWDTLKQQIAFQDTIKDISIKDYMPEMAKILERSKL